MAEAENVAENVFENGLKQINRSGRIARAINAATRAIIKKKAQIVFLADDIDNKDYKNLITALCQKYGVKLVNVPSKASIGKALGLTNMKSNGDVRKQINCGVCAIVKYGSVETPDVLAFRAQYDPIE